MSGDSSNTDVNMDDTQPKVVDENLQHEDMRKLFVSEVPSSVTDDQFQEAIVSAANSGDADDILDGFKVIRKPNMKYCYAFVMFTVITIFGLSVDPFILLFVYWSVKISKSCLLA